MEGKKMSEIDLITRRYLAAIKSYEEQKKMLQDQAIQRADRRRLRLALLRNGLLFIVAAVSIFALIRWLGP